MRLLCPEIADQLAKQLEEALSKPTIYDWSSKDVWDAFYDGSITDKGAPRKVYTMKIRKEREGAIYESRVDAGCEERQEEKSQAMSSPEEVWYRSWKFPHNPSKDTDIQCSIVTRPGSSEGRE